jgi:basic amino acid/polyamine antiporter, APA family
MEGNSNRGDLRKIGMFSASGIVVANMIGAGIFTTSGLILAGLGNPVLMILLWFLGGVIALCGALAYSELGKAMPRAGGEYAFLSQLYHPLPGFLSGWVSFIVGFSAPIAASAIGFSEYLHRAFPGFPVSNKVLAAIVIIAFTVVHLRGIRFGAKVQNFLTILKVGIILVLILAGLFLGKGNIEHFTEGSPVILSFSGLKTMGLSLMWIMFAYSGWNASTYIGSEILHPVRNIPRSLLLGTSIVLILYVMLNFIYTYAISPEDMKGVISIGGLAMRNLFGNTMEIAFSLLISFALFSSLSAFIILGPRVYYAMAVDGYFFRFLARVHPRFGVPSAAIIMQACLAVVMAVSGTFDQILTYMGFSLGFFPILAVGSVFKLRRIQKKHSGLWGFPFYLPVYLFFSLAVLILSYAERPTESSFALLTIISGIPLFFYFRSRKNA